MTPRILVMAGSRRSASLNRLLAHAAAASLQRAGAQVTALSMDEHALPMYDGDVESGSGLPPAALRLKALFKAHHGVFVASPEYNASVSPLLKNVIDWTSRSTVAESGKVPFQGKVFALASASPSALGGQRGLAHLRQILQSLGAWVLPAQLGIPNAARAFSAEGAPADAAQAKALDDLAAELVSAAARLAPPVA